MKWSECHCCVCLIKLMKEKMVTSRGVDRHFHGLGSRNCDVRVKHLVTQPGNAPKARPSHLTTADEVNKVSEGLAFKDRKGRVLQRMQTLNWDAATDSSLTLDLLLFFLLLKLFPAYLWHETDRLPRLQEVGIGSILPVWPVFKKSCVDPLSSVENVVLASC